MTSQLDYYGRLKKVWDQLQVLEPLPDCSCGALPKCSCNMFAKLLETNHLKRLIQFTAGLHKDYGGAKTNLLSMDPLPTVNKAYHIMLQIEKHNSLTNLHGNPSDFMSISRFNAV